MQTLVKKMYPFWKPRACFFESKDFGPGEAVEPHDVIGNFTKPQPLTSGGEMSKWSRYRILVVVLIVARNARIA